MVSNFDADAFKGYLSEGSNARFWAYLSALNQAYAHRFEGFYQHLTRAQDALDSVAQKIDGEVQPGESIDDAIQRSEGLAVTARRASYELLDSINDLCVAIDSLLILCEAVSTEQSAPMAWLGRRSHGLGELRDTYATLSAGKARQILGLLPESNGPITESLESKDTARVDAYIDLGVTEFRNRFRAVLKFHSSWRRAFNKYKHAPLEETGNIVYRETGEQAEVGVLADIVVRGDDQEGSPGFETLKIPCSQPTLDRVNTVAEQTVSLYATTIASQVLYHLNLGKGNHVPTFHFPFQAQTLPDGLEKIIESLPYAASSPEHALRSVRIFTFEEEAGKKIRKALTQGIPVTFGRDLMDISPDSGAFELEVRLLGSAE